MTDTFIPYPSIKRGLDFGWMCITEKIDGANAQITINDKKVVMIGAHKHTLRMADDPSWIDQFKDAPDRDVLLITEPRRQLFGFAGWVFDHKEELEAKLNNGTYYGEWYGPGINKNRDYNLTQRRFAFFSAHKWTDPQRPRISDSDIVPILYIGPIKTEECEKCMEGLAEGGSRIVPGFMNPEGIVIELPQLDVMRKYTFNGNKHKYLLEKTNEQR
jgi:hypothetical protein